MSRPLTQAEFGLWRDGDSQFKTAVLQHIEAQTALNIEFASRVGGVEKQQEDCTQSISRRSGLIASVVSAIVGALTAAFFGSR